MAESIDTSGSVAYNADINESDVVVNMAERQPLNNTKCTHEKDGLTTFVQDSDEVGGQVAWVCTQCARGTFLPKGVQIT